MRHELSGMSARLEIRPPSPPRHAWQFCSLCRWRSAARPRAEPRLASWPATAPCRDPRFPIADAVVVKGQFLTIQAGESAVPDDDRRAGAEKLRVRAQVYQMTEHGLARISEGEGEAYGDRMPGMAVPVGAGAVAGRAASAAVITGGMNVVQETTGGLDASVGRLAEQLAERAVSFYACQGWL